MMYEVEQKFPASDLPAVRDRLETLGTVWQPERTQVDTYFQHPTRDFSQTDEAIRLRRVGSANRLTYKGPKIDQVTKTRREVEVGLAEGESTFSSMKEALEALGFTPVREVTKTRLPGQLTWRGAEVEVAVDNVEGLGGFVELERLVNDAELDEARLQIGELAEHLQLGPPERRSYLELLQGHTPGSSP